MACRLGPAPECCHSPEQHQSCRKGYQMTNCHLSRILQHSCRWKVWYLCSTGGRKESCRNNLGTPSHKLYPRWYGRDCRNRCKDSSSQLLFHTKWLSCCLYLLPCRCCQGYHQCRHGWLHRSFPQC